MKVYKWILCIVLVAVLGFCFIRFGNFQSDKSTDQTPVQTTAAAEPVEPTEFSFSAEEYTTRLLTALNAYRERFGVAAWSVDETLTSAANTRASECAIMGSKSHTRPDGGEWYTVLGISENLNYSEITGISGHTPDDMLRKWVASDSINNGILSADYTACGIGCEAIGSKVYCALILYRS